MAQIRIAADEDFRAQERRIRSVEFQRAVDDEKARLIRRIKRLTWWRRFVALLKETLK